MAKDRRDRRGRGDRSPRPRPSSSTEEGFEVVGETGRGDEAVELAQRSIPTSSSSTSRCRGWTGLQAAAAINASCRHGDPRRHGVQRAGADRAGARLRCRRLPRQALPQRGAPSCDRDRARARRRSDGDRGRARRVGEDADGDARRLETRRMVDRAKAKLMDDHGLREPDAFAFIESTAKDRGTSLREVARRGRRGSARPLSDASGGRDEELRAHPRADGDGAVLGGSSSSSRVSVPSGAASGRAPCGRERGRGRSGRRARRWSTSTCSVIRASVIRVPSATAVIANCGVGSTAASGDRVAVRTGGRMAEHLVEALLRRRRR